MRSDRVALIIFVKNPELGEVKTRLAQDVGDARALEIYKQLVTFTVDVVKYVRSDKFVYYSEHVPDRDDWLPIADHRRVQSGADLGSRMENAIKDLIPNYDKVILIGSDCGELSSEILMEAIDSLCYTPTVLGPSKDGGYYLIGTSNLLPGLFDDIEWSTETVFSVTIRKLLASETNFSLLDTLNDVDTIEDWRELNW